MILIDLNQILLGGLVAQLKSQQSNEINENEIRPLLLNTLRMYVHKFNKEYGDVILCCDNRKYWRKEVFPNYKITRKKNRDKSDFDWNLIFDFLAKFKIELKENFPYRVVDVEGAEADDIIGVLTRRHIAHEDILILSSDGDFIQLQKYNKNSKFNVKQYNPSLKKFIKSSDPERDLRIKIIEGDRGDAIPNILSPDNCFADHIRQRTLTEKKLNLLLEEDINDWEDEVAKRGFSRNELLIDLEKIPDKIKEKIINNFEEAKPASRQKLFNYLIEKRLKLLIDVIEEF